MAQTPAPGHCQQVTEMVVLALPALGLIIEPEVAGDKDYPITPQQELILSARERLLSMTEDG